MKQYAIYCSVEQTRRALELGCPLYTLSMSVEDSHLRDKSIRIDDGYELIDYAIPTAEEMIGWLNDKGIIVSILFGYTVSDKWEYDLDGKEYFEYKASGEYDTREEATLAAIDASLEYLEKHKA